MSLLPLQPRILGGVNSSSSSLPSPHDNKPSQIEIVDSDFVLILVVLLCALICVLGLVAVARCSWIRRILGRVSANSDPPPPPPAPNDGLEKKVLRSLPKFTYPVQDAWKLSHPDCPICLTEFTAGDAIRLLPQCGHGFHVGCIDTWLRSHPSCPSCRQILVGARCQKCKEFPAPTSSSIAEAEAEAEAQSQATVTQRQDINYINRFLP